MKRGPKASVALAVSSGVIAFGLGIAAIWSDGDTSGRLGQTAGLFGCAAVCLALVGFAWQDLS